MQSPEKYRELYEKQGLHMMVLMLNDGPAQAVINHDWFLRLAMAAVALSTLLRAAVAAVRVTCALRPADVLIEATGVPTASQMPGIIRSGASK